MADVTIRTVLEGVSGLESRLLNIEGAIKKLGASGVSASAQLGKFNDGLTKQQSLFGSTLTSLTAFAAGYLSLNVAVNILRDSVTQAVDAERQTVLLKRAVESAGISWKVFGGQIDDVVQATAKYAKAQDQDASAALRRLVIVTGDVTGSMKNLNLVFDLMREKSMGAEQAALIIGKAMEGDIATLGRFLPDIKELTDLLGSNADKSVLAAKALDILSQKVGGSGGQFGEAEGKLRDFTVAWKEFEELLGERILPLLTKIIGVMTHLAGGLLDPSKQVAWWDAQFAAISRYGDAIQQLPPPESWAVPSSGPVAAKQAAVAAPSFNAGPLQLGMQQVQDIAKALSRTIEQLTPEALAMERELTAGIVSESQRREAAITLELGDRIAKITALTDTAQTKERLITMANQAAAYQRRQIYQDTLTAGIQMEQALSLDLMSESQKRAATIDISTQRRLDDINKLVLTTQEKEHLITLAVQAGFKQQEDAARAHAVDLMSLEAEMTGHIVDNVNTRIMAVDAEYAARLAMIEKLAKTAEEKEALITLAAQEHATKRMAISGTLSGFVIEQFKGIQDAATFSFAFITTSFADATASLIEGTNTFHEFFKSVLHLMLSAVVNFVLGWIAKQALAYLFQETAGAESVGVHEGVEKAKTAVTAAGELERLLIIAGTNKVMLAGVIATLAAISAVGAAAMSTMTAVVAATGGILVAIGTALAASIVGAPMAPAFFEAALAVFIGGGIAVGAGITLIGAAVAAATAAATAALVTPFAEGGIVTAPTLSLLGEAGPEAVIPLSRAGQFGFGERSGSSMSFRPTFNGPVIFDGISMRQWQRRMLKIMDSEWARTTAPA